MIYNLISQYRKLSKPVKAAMWFMICSFLQKGISMLTTPIFTRMLTEEEYGLFSVYTSWQVIFDVFISLSISSSAMIYFSKFENPRKALSSFCGIELLFGVFWGTLLAVFGEQIAELIKLPYVLCICLLIQIIFGQIIDLWMIYRRILYDYQSIMAITLINSVLSSVISVVVVLAYSPTAVGRVVSIVSISLLLGIMLLYSVLRSNRNLYDREVWSFTFKLGIAAIFDAISQFVLTSSDKLMINAMCGTREVALYSVAYSVGSLIGFFTQAINGSYTPYQYQHIKSKSFLSLAKRGYEVLAFVGLILVGIMLFGHEIIWIFGGSKYFESENLIIPICLGTYFSFLHQLFSKFQEFYVYRLTLTLSSFCCAVLNIGLNYVFISLYGYQAAAYTTVVCYFLYCLFHYFSYRWLLKRELDDIQVYDMRIIGCISTIVVILGIIISFIYQLLWIKLVLLAAFTILVCIRKKEFIALTKRIMAKQ